MTSINLTQQVHYTPQIESALSRNNLKHLQKQILKHLHNKVPQYQFELSTKDIHHYINSQIGDLANQHDFGTVERINWYVFHRVVPYFLSQVYAQQHVRFVNHQQFKSHKPPPHQATGHQDFEHLQTFGRLHTGHHSRQYQRLQQYLAHS